MWELISVSSNDVEEQGFWDALRVWMGRPHIINRRLMGIDVASNWMLRVNAPIAISSDDVWHMLNAHNSAKIDLENIFKNEAKLVHCEQEDIWEENGNNSGLFIQIRRLLPKQPKKFKVETETVIIDRNEKSVTFISPHCDENNCVLTPAFDYRLTLTDKSRIKLERAVDNQGPTSHQHSLQWLESHVFYKICNWAKQHKNSNSIPSLNIIPITKYYMIYQRLKQTYWHKLVEMWPECTDPVKFIYEDIAIAAYLLTIFDMEMESKNLHQKQSFVDLGCGNGLLVYLLTAEGHSGIGIDVRKRTIWDLYGPEVQLIETAVTPSAEMLFPDYDWLIGNHSDELTPWIPVIAARSSYNMRVFLLPCCAFSFEGKYQRIHSGCSQYQSYLSFISDVCEKMGFNVQQDKLRIPSTKRLCFVCLSRNYLPLEEDEVDHKRTEYIKQFIKHSPLNTDTDLCICPADNNRNLNLAEQKGWTVAFQPRKKLQEVVNCSHLDSTFLENVVTKLAIVLLNLETTYVKVINSDKEVNWNKGGELTIGELASLLGPELLQQLKHQCGGLQTLLRNHKHIFTVKNGKVSIVTPLKDTGEAKLLNKKQQRKKGPRYKTRPCWFYHHHPQSCPLGDNCTYIHEERIN